MEELDKIIQRLYEDSVFGKLSDERFQKLSAQYEAEQKEIKTLASVLEREIEDGAKQAVDVERFLHLAERYSELQKLDAATVNELIDRIVVHAPEGGRANRTQQVDIHFRFNVVTATATADFKQYYVRRKAV